MVQSLQLMQVGKPSARLGLEAFANGVFDHSEFGDKARISRPDAHFASFNAGGKLQDQSWKLQD